jgi:hypothetical protein
VPIGRSDVDDVTAALFHHDARLVLHAEDHAENVSVKRRGKALRRLIGDRANLTFGAGIVYGDIERAKACNGLVDQSPNVVVLTNIPVDKLRLGT